ncbi:MULTISPECIES: methylenetetrahydrofolate reductase [NAD(P)H] [unclassified Psychrobacter]|uniref:methylenetetrahydrofolate reductase [NAD(P)H] n=1 Tax=unclassified Psychrobacter TaxID=196806 RepID=UPI0025B348BF|nr:MULTISPECIES: methylenetetrahydrofolate reductase [NAD(P)H] [unclassified Psychrobacter]MDN3454325.1 methylenetetrahydrofolate reductase [NAD(P)H] [Psychrobacter sp. APC 3350]MDN3503557.1 methylenetetrahydrofolate reductase [NAD(P)H] [Psychrobacter sp. 5A.1]
MSKPAFSFEFFPVKTEQGHEKLLNTYDELNKLSPSYFSVTYGAGGSTRSRTLDIVQALNARGDTEIAPHISCIGDDKNEIAELLEFYKTLGIKRLVALRGDLPSGQVGMGELPFAVDLVKFIREHSGDHFHIEVAAYPEMHPQARSFDFDVDNLVNKYQAGANASITQFFYNADSYLYLRDRVEKRGIDTVTQPLIAGIMPITNSSSLMRFADSCGADIPRYVRKQLGDFGDDRKAIREFGFEVVYRLCERLMNEGVPAMHFYSMNKVEPNKRLIEALGLTV